MADARPALLERPDREYGVVERLRYWRCQRPDCGVVFAFPLPNESTLLGFYREYSTHGKGSPSSLATWLAARHRRNQVDELGPPVACLDFGCGDGQLLAALREQGWTQLLGYDADAGARAAASSLGLQIVDQIEEAIAGGPYQLILLNHVLEHLPHPLETLRRLTTALAPGGRIVVRTPNAGSSLARLFGDDWRGWETPRHLHIFTAPSLRRLAAKLEQSGELRAEALSSSNRMFLGIFHGSFKAEFWRRPGAGPWLRRALSLLAWPAAELLRVVLDRCGLLLGEELCFSLRRP